MTTFIGVDDVNLEWTGAMPAVYQSSPKVERWFCAKCGTPMAYRNERFGHETHLYAASLDDPSGVTPQKHFFWNEKLPWLHLADPLPHDTLTDV